MNRDLVTMNIDNCFDYIYLFTDFSIQAGWRSIRSPGKYMQLEDLITFKYRANLPVCPRGKTNKLCPVKM